MKALILRILYDTVNENLIDSSILIYISNEKLENPGMPDVNGEKYTLYSIYDYNCHELIKHNRIFNSSKTVDGMELYQGNVCTVYFDGAKYYYFWGSIEGDNAAVTNQRDNYCNTIYDQCH